MHKKLRFRNGKLFPLLTLLFFVQTDFSQLPDFVFSGIPAFNAMTFGVPGFKPAMQEPTFMSQNNHTILCIK